MNKRKLLYVSEIQVDFVPKYRHKIKVKESKHAEEVFRFIWEGISYTESMYIMLLSSAGNIMGVKKVSEGSVLGTVADPKKIFGIVLKSNAPNIILAHNHPSGNPKPSEADIKITKKCAAIADLHDVKMLDHIILMPEGGYTSMADEGVI